MKLSVLSVCVCMWALVCGGVQAPPQTGVVHAQEKELPSVKKEEVKPTPAPPKPKKAEAPRLVMQAEQEGDVGQFISVRPSETNGASVKYISLTPGLSVFPSDQLRDPKSTVVVAMTAGRYKLLAYTAVADLPSDPVTTTIVIGGTPAPPPTPDNPPKPPDPGPPPGTLNKVLFLYEAQANNSQAQNIVRTSTKVREYLNAKPGVGNYYFWDYHQQLNPSVPQEWRELIEAAKKKVVMKDGKAQWTVVLVKGNVGDYYPVVDEASTLELLKKYGG